MFGFFLAYMFGFFCFFFIMSQLLFQQSLHSPVKQRMLDKIKQCCRISVKCVISDGEIVHIVALRGLAEVFLLFVVVLTHLNLCLDNLTSNSHKVLLMLTHDTFIASFGRLPLFVFFLVYVVLVILYHLRKKLCINSHTYIWKKVTLESICAHFTLFSILSLCSVVYFHCVFNDVVVYCMSCCVCLVHCRVFLEGGGLNNLCNK